MSATTPIEKGPRAEYGQRIAQRSAAIAIGDRRALWLSNGRLAVAGVAFVVLWGVVRGAWSPFWVLAPAFVFAVLAIIHAHVLNKQERLHRAVAFYEHGIRRIDGTWAEKGGGSRSRPANGPDAAPDPFTTDPLARDLDLFGPGSLFQLLNTARTQVGERTLADWLRAPADPDEVRSRQRAVAELRDLLDFREDIAVLAAEAEVGRTDRLAAWASEAPAAFAPAVRMLFAACAVITIALATAVFLFERIEIVWLGLWILVQSGLAYFWKKRLAYIIAAVGTPEHDLKLLGALLERIERQTFSSDRLVGLRNALISDGAPPSRQIGRLERLVSWLDATFNLLFAPFAYSVLMREQLAIAIDRWHHQHRLAVLEWLRRAGEIEALASLAALAYEHPADPFPEFADAGPIFEADGLGHPLMTEHANVRNDIAIGGAHPLVLIVSGSNMSGKSTLLRAVGVNVVLAQAGATVRAARIRLSPLAIGATIRVDDSLQEGRSRFYAEILRLRDILQQASTAPVLFLLDEILHGTNSYDRRIGAEAIVQALVARGAVGLVTTHDLALTELTTKLGAAASNVHFEDRIEDGKMVFDYRMRSGIVEHSNALALMRAIGIDV